MENTEISVEMFLSQMTRHMNKYPIDHQGSWWALLEEHPDGTVTHLDTAMEPQICYMQLLLEDKFRDREYNKDVNLHLYIFLPPISSEDTYNDFILNRSWFRGVFLTKTTKDKYVEINMNLPNSNILAGLVALRLANESTTANRELFTKFVKMGLSEREAFLLYAMIYSAKKDGPFALIPYDLNNHNVFDFNGHGFYSVIELDIASIKGDIQYSWGETCPKTIRDIDLFERLLSIFNKHSINVPSTFSSGCNILEYLTDGILEEFVQAIKEG